MSQEKVDRYKKEKANRKKNVKRDKIRNALRKCAVGLVGLALIGWIGYSAYGTYESSKPKEEVQVDYTALNNLSKQLDEAAQEAQE